MLWIFQMNSHHYRSTLDPQQSHCLNQNYYQASKKSLGNNKCKFVINASVSELFRMPIYYTKDLHLWHQQHTRMQKAH